MRPNASKAEGHTSMCVVERVQALQVDHLPTSQAVAIAFVGHVLGLQIRACGHTKCSPPTYMCSMLPSSYLGSGTKPR